MPSEPLLGFDYQVEQDKIARQQRIADAMMQMALTPQQGQMVSGRYVAPNLIQQLMPLIGTMAADRQQNQINDQRRELVQRYNTKLSEGLDSYFKTRDGTPAFAGTPSVPAQELPTEDGANFQMPENPGLPSKAAVPGDPRRAAVMALTSGLPALSKLGQSDLEAQAKGALTPKEILALNDYEAGSRLYAALRLDPRLLRPKAEYKALGETLWRMPSEGMDKPQLALDARPQFGAPFQGPDGNYFQSEIGRPETATTPGLRATEKWNRLGPGVEVKLDNSQNKGQVAGMQQFAELAGKTVSQLADGARASARALTALNNISSRSDAGVIQGPLANFGIFMGQLGNSMGFRVDAAKLANSETANSEIIRLWTDMMAANGGARGLVKEESDRMFSSLPTLMQTAEGRMDIIRVLRMKAQQDIEVARQASQEFSQALLSQDPARFTFGLGAAMLPSPAMDPKAGVPPRTVQQPGAPIAPGLKVPEGWSIRPRGAE